MPGMAEHHGPLSSETGSCPFLQRVAYRSFDRKWVVPDARVHHRPSPSLWLTASSKQVFVVEQHAHPISDGPALMFTSLIPDMHHHSGRGGRVLPLYRDADACIPNLTPGLLRFLGTQLGSPATGPDVVAYLAAVTAHPGFTRRFATDLTTPGVRLPLTQDPKLWRDAVLLGREVLWLHTYGERFADQTVGRRAGPPRLGTDRPTVRVGIPDTEEGMPERITYDESTRTLHVGDGQIAPVSPEVWKYQVAGMWVLKHWFGYRKKNPSGNRTSALDHIIATTWTPAMTTELLELINVLGRCVELEPRQADLLDRIMAGPLITIDDLTAASVLPVPATARTIPKSRREDDLFSSG